MARFRFEGVDGEVVLVIVLAIAAVATMIFLAINDTSSEAYCLASGGLWLPGHAFISGGVLVQSYKCYKVKSDPCKTK